MARNFELDDLRKPEMRAQAEAKIKPAIAETLRGRKRKELTFYLSSRPYSTKNSRALGNGRSFMNKGAAAWLKDAKQELATQYKGDPLTGAFELEIRVYYADRRHHLDLDNAAAGLCDALKGIVVVDDDPSHICKLTVCSAVSRVGRASVELTLTEAL